MKIGKEGCLAPINCLTIAALVCASGYIMVKGAGRELGALGAGLAAKAFGDSENFVPDMVFDELFYESIRTGVYDAVYGDSGCSAWRARDGDPANVYLIQADHCEAFDESKPRVFRDVNGVTWTLVDDSEKGCNQAYMSVGGWTDVSVLGVKEDCFVPDDPNANPHPGFEINTNRPTSGEKLLGVGYPGAALGVLIAERCVVGDPYDLTHEGERRTGIECEASLFSPSGPGQSGGPFFNDDGEVVGVTSMGIMDTIFVSDLNGLPEAIEVMDGFLSQK